MKKHNFTWTLTALLLIAFVVAAPPSASPNTPQMPSTFPDSNPDIESGIHAVAPDDGAVVDVGTIDFTGEVYGTVDECRFFLDDEEVGSGQAGTVTRQVSANTWNEVAYTHTFAASEVGDHEWYFQCEADGTTMNTTTRTLTVIEPTAPFTFTNVMPADDASSSTGNQVFSATINKNPTSCALIIHGSAAGTPTITGSTLTITKSFATGAYDWRFSCQYGGSTYLSPERMLSVIVCGGTVTGQQYFCDYDGNESTPPDPTAPFTYTNVMPADDASSSTGNQVFSATINKDPTSCALIIDGSAAGTPTITGSTLTITKSFATGAYDWRFSCQYGGSTYLSPERTLIVDGLEITSLLPEDEKSIGYGTVTFSVGLNAAPEECTLTIDGLSFTMEEVGNGAERDIPFSSNTVGNHTWNVLCTRGAEARQSQERTITITAAPQQAVDLSLDEEEYYPGATMTLTAKRFSPLQDDIIIYVKKGLTRIHTGSAETTITDEFAYEYDLSSTAAVGNYTIEVINMKNTTQSGIVPFAVVLPEAELFLSDELVIPGEMLDVYGYDFLTDAEVTLTVTQDEQKIDEQKFDADEDGEFVEEIVVGETLGEFTVTAEQEAGVTATAMYTVIAPSNLTERTFYADDDGDGFGFLSKTIVAQTRPQGYVTNFDDCDDTRATVRPGATEVCDGLDNDCNGFVDTGNLCPAGQECSLGQCSVVQTTATPTTGSGSSPTAPTTEQPAKPTTPTDSVPNFQEPESGRGLLWWFLIPLLVIILIAGGFLGFVAYEGYLDMSSPEAFVEGIKKSLGMTGGASVGEHEVQIPQGDFALLTKFITSKRKDGYDDLTIRNSLLKKGWREEEVDGVFDQLYK